MNQTYEKILGCLYGTAYGDAMGMPSEMWSRQKIKSHFGMIDGFLPGQPENQISKGLAKGEVTDDTINTIFVVEMLSESNGKVDPALWVNKVKKWAETSKKSTAVIGPSTARAFEQLTKGMPMEQAGKTGITNGAAMKVSPLGIIIDYKDMDKLVDNVHRLCLPTHNTSIAVSGACAVAAAVSYSIQCGCNLNEMLEVSMEAAEAGAKKGWEVCAPSISRRIAYGKKFIDNEKDSEKVLSFIYDIMGTGLPISESVPAALLLAYYAKGNPAACAKYCANIGGDTDTIGAISCSICGALNGAGAFPKEDINLLETTNDICFDSLANSLYKIKEMK